MSLVRLNSVHKHFQRGSGPVVHAVNGVSLEVGARETVAIVGESGSGKSTVGRLALGLHPADHGTVEVFGKSLETLSEKQLRGLRRRMSMVFQEPYESLNPRMQVATIVGEPLQIHEPRITSDERRERVVDALKMVTLDGSFARRLPHELSGGQQQRVGIARAIITRPSFIVLDEPTSSLDLSVRAQILQLLARLQDELNLAYLFISHDIHTVEYISDRIAVLYLGRVVELGTTEQVFNAPQHPYTQALLSSTLSANPRFKRERLLLQGEITSPTALPRGCFFYGRCPVGTEDCTRESIELRRSAVGHEVACIMSLGALDKK